MTILRTALIVFAARAVCLSQGGACSELRSAVKSTYDFNPSKLTEAQQKKKSAEMNKVWNLVEAHHAEMAPCLMDEMAGLDADRWFLFDAGSLLQQFDHSPRANRMILRGCLLTDLDDA